jgi:hypothetical protein
MSPGRSLRLSLFVMLVSVSLNPCLLSRSARCPMLSSVHVPSRATSHRPWTIDEHAKSFIVRDATAQALG